ncbi:MAG: hypothetical protein JWM11_1846, partial [Planctomycetaceae bacterium]|nr:hypothetical protein [Planctomycetaceae bacterium]
MISQDGGRGCSWLLRFNLALPCFPFSLRRDRPALA